MSIIFRNCLPKFVVTDSLCCLSIEAMRTIDFILGGVGTSFPMCAQMAGEANLRAKGLAAVGAGDGAGSLRLQGFFLPLLPTSLSREDFVGLILASTTMDECSPLCSVCGFFLPCVWVDPKGLKGDF